MKNFLAKFSLVAALGLLCLAAPAVHAQQAQPIQQSASVLDAASQISSSATTGATITLTPNGGQYVYITGLDIANCGDATGVSAAAVTSLTTTNLGSAAWTIGSGQTAGNCMPSPVGTFSRPVRSTAAGTAVTFVLPTFATHQTVRVNVYWYSAP